VLPVKQIKVILLDKRELFRAGLARVLESSPNISVISQCSTPNECLEQAMQLKPDVVVMDTEKARCDFVKVIQNIGESLPETRIVMLTHSEEDGILFAALKAGARGYVSKDIGVEDLFAAITRVDAGDVIITPPMAARLLNEEFALPKKDANNELPESETNLSQREAEVLRLVAEGKTNKEIATTLFITVNTVKVHLSRILEKLRVRNRQQAVALAMEKGIVGGRSKETTSQE
jgi:RNA polymerase sigma factor (sigma-70 family)